MDHPTCWQRLPPTRHHPFQLPLVLPWQLSQLVPFQQPRRLGVWNAVRQPRPRPVLAIVLTVSILARAPRRQLFSPKPSFVPMAFIPRHRMFLYRKSMVIRLMGLRPQQSRLHRHREIVLDRLLEAVPIRMPLDRLRLVLPIVMVLLLVGILCMVLANQPLRQHLRQEDMVECRSKLLLLRMLSFSLRYKRNKSQLINNQNTRLRRSCRHRPIRLIHNNSRRRPTNNSNLSTLPTNRSQWRNNCNLT
mmetsp:Transcript_13497/g.24430  ORF Transcript_13497/g.24430 Transcript_13497/m.24430 type:complete len:247 (-) Transcript_13497:783-1523(-)